MVVGHTHFSPDRAFAWIQAVLKFKELYCPNDVLTACKAVEGITDVSLVDQFWNFKECFEDLFDDVSGIRDVAELMVHEDDPTGFFTRKTLSLSVSPDINTYIRHNLWLNVDKTVQESTLEKLKSGLTLVPTREITEKKKLALQKLYTAGIVPRSLSEYYFGDESSWNKKNQEETIIELQQERKKELQEQVLRQLEQNKKYQESAVKTVRSDATSKVLHGVVIKLLDFDDDDLKVQIRQTIVESGGSILQKHSSKVTHVVVQNDEISAKTATKARGLPIVAAQWILESIKQCTLLDPQEYQACVVDTLGKKRKRLSAGTDKRARPTISNDDTEPVCIILPNDIINDEPTSPVASSIDEETIQIESADLDTMQQDVELINDDDTIDWIERTNQQNRLIVGNIVVNEQDLARLEPGELLNDVIIDAYLHLLQETVSHVYCFSTFFFTRLKFEITSESTMRINYAKVSRWTKDIDLFSFSTVIIPINYQLHWTLAVINFNTGTIQYYDSLMGDRSNKAFATSVCADLVEYLMVEHLNKKNCHLGFSMDIDILLGCEIPQQDNSVDCGVFLCNYARCILQQPFKFDQATIGANRVHIRECIANKQFFVYMEY
jgi:hypothetical protein